jgi:phosphotransferase family enzyme
VRKDVAAGQRRLANPPKWLRAALNTALVLAALSQYVPDVELEDAKVRRLVLAAGSQHWVGTYQVATASGKVQLLGTLAPPHVATPPDRDSDRGAAFGTLAWSRWLPELGLELRTQPPETALSGFDDLTDPDQARSLMARALGKPVTAAVPEVLAYKPGSRAVIRYQLAYPAGTSGPETVIAKTYRRDKGQNAYDGMRALWASPLASGEVVEIAEPVAYVPDSKLLLQRPISGSQTLEEVLTGMFKTGGTGVPAEVARPLAASGTGLAALHTSGATFAGTFTLAERIDDARELLDRLAVAVPAPELAEDFGPLVERVAQLAAELPAGPERPSHGTFDPEQVLLNGDRVGFIDFDDAAMAEAALDVGLFLAALPDLALEAGGQAHPERQLDRAAALGEAFMTAYEAGAPLSRERVALWQTTDYLIDALHTWSKVKPSGPGKDLAVLDHHLRHHAL